jgi:hypothetical protein
MPNRCVAFGCTNTYKDVPGVFKFPSDPVLRKQWIDQVKRTRDKWRGPSAHSVLCSKHFTSDSFDDNLSGEFGINKRISLKPGAVPSIFQRPQNSLPSSTAGPCPKKRRMAVSKLSQARVSMTLISGYMYFPLYMYTDSK